MAAYVTEEDEIWNPVRKQFYPIAAVRIVKEPIWELVTSSGAVGYSSFRHPVLWYQEHATGEPVENFIAGNPVLCVQKKRIVNTLAVLSRHGVREGQAEAIERYAFYERVKKAYAIVVTGELEPWGNFILRKGVLCQALRP